MSDPTVLPPPVGNPSDRTSGAGVPAPDVVISHPRPPRRGNLTVGWLIVTAITWVCVILAFAAVWNASVQLGLSTWWLGARAEPRSRLIQLSPFVAPVLMVLATVNQVRWLPVSGVVASGVLAAIGVADLDRVATLATIELAIAAAAAVVSIVSSVGLYRRTGQGPTSTASDAAAVA